MSLQVLIVDDEKAARQKIRSLLKGYEGIDEIQEAENGQIALEMILNFKPDLIFMDIQMPGLTGIEVANQCLHLIHKLVFVTAYDEFALKAFETHAIDYLLKPVSKARFQQTMERILNSKKVIPDDSSKLKELLQNLITTPKTSRLAIKSSGSLLLIDSEDIAYCNAEEGIAKIYLLESGKRSHKIDSLYSDLSLTELLTRLPNEDFLQVHRSYLVNLKQILAIHPDGRSHYLQLKDFPNLRIPVSRSQFSELQLRLQRL